MSNGQERKPVIELIYEEACSLSQENPELKGRIAGECANISYSVLGLSKQCLHPEITLAVGWVEIAGVELFKPQPKGKVRWDGGIPKLRYHCWLQGPGVLIDLTLAASLRENPAFDHSLIPDQITFIGRREAKDLGITYNVIVDGDDALIRFHRLYVPEFNPDKPRCHNQKPKGVLRSGLNLLSTPFRFIRRLQNTNS